MNYQPPMVEDRQSIDAPFVLGGTYILSPTWTDEPDGNEQVGA